MGRTNRYRVVVDYWTDKFRQDRIETVSEHKTLKEAKEARDRCYRIKHFDCGYTYYIQAYKGTKWDYVGEAPKLTYEFHSIKLDNKKVIKLPITVTLTRAETYAGNAFAVIEQLVKNWPKEAK